LFPKLSPWLFKQMTPLPERADKNVFKGKRQTVAAQGA
jgi:hypothetical protein